MAQRKASLKPTLVLRRITLNISKYAVICIMFFNKFALANVLFDESAAVALNVYKTPSCSCCNKWLSHLEQTGIETVAINQDNLSPIKSSYGIAGKYRSCHTAVTKQGIVFEGHIPAKIIKQYLSENHPNAIGLSVPAMPLGSVGMEVGDHFMPYKVLIMFKDGTSEIYARVDTYKEQF